MPKGMPGSETRKPDDYEFYLEAILEAPRGQRQIWQGGEYVPAWKSGPSANLYPCAGNGGCGTGAYGGCADGKCGPATTGYGRPPMAAPPTSLPAREPPTVRADPPSSLLDPDRPDRRTAELPQR
jgi:pilus assembly protein CpaC